MISLEKKDIVTLTKDVTISLAKNNMSNVSARVVLALDISGSMTNMYADGTVQAAADRVLALASRFDDDQSVDVFVFDTGTRQIGAMDLANRSNWIDKNVSRLVGGGTNYSPVIRDITKKFGNKQQKSGGFLGFGGKVESVEPADLPTYVLFMTDGDAGDRAQATDAITEASQHGIFWQFVGIGSGYFQFLQQLDTMSGRYLDNANFFQLNGKVNDAELYDKLLAEFPSWISAARSKGLIK